MADKAAVTTDQVVEISPEEAEAQFAQGFENVRPKPTSTDVELGGGEDAQTIGQQPTQTGDKQPAAAKPQNDDPDPALKGLSKRMRKLEGQFGTINENLSKLAKAIEKPADTTASTAAEQATAQADRLAAIESVIGEYDQFKPLMEEVFALREKMEKLSEGGATQANVDKSTVDIDKLTAEITELVTLNTKFPDWKKDTSTPEFKGFMLANGPEESEYDDYRAILDDPKTVANAQEIVLGWKEDHPKWWDDRGKYLFSTKAEDSVAMLERYTELKSLQEGGRNSVKNRTDRLRRSVVPEGTVANPVTGKSDEDAFNNGFKRGSAKYGGIKR